MKKLSILLFSLSLLWTPIGFADDISDFSIEGMSIGDSLLDYMTEDEILKAIKKTKDWYLHVKEPYKYSQVDLFKDFSTYDSVGFFIKNNSTNQYVVDKNEKFIILLIRGKINYIEDFDSCLKKRDEIDEVLSSMFPNVQKTEFNYKSAFDSSGKSIVYTIDYKFKSGDEISNYCVNYDESIRIKRNWSEGLTIGIETAEIRSWLVNYE